MAKEYVDAMIEVRPADLFAALRRFVATNAIEPLSREGVLLLVAHFAFETNGGKACHNFNLGNVKCPPEDTTHDYQFFACWEIVHGAKVWLHPPDPGCRFRAYGTLDEGAADHLAFLRGRFGYAWPCVVDPDPAEFCNRLHKRGYFTAPLDEYTAGVSEWYVRLDALLPRDTNDPAAGGEEPQS